MGSVDLTRLTWLAIWRLGSVRGDTIGSVHFLDPCSLCVLCNPYLYYFSPRLNPAYIERNAEVDGRGKERLSWPLPAPSAAHERPQACHQQAIQCCGQLSFCCHLCQRICHANTANIGTPCDGQEHMLSKPFLDKAVDK